MRARLQWLTGALLGEDWAGGWFHRDRSDVSSLALEIARHTGNRPPCSNARYEYINLTISVIPDFRAGGLFMYGGIGRVLEFLQQDVMLRVGSNNFLGLGYC